MVAQHSCLLVRCFAQAFLQFWNEMAFTLDNCQNCHTFLKAVWVLLTLNQGQFLLNSKQEKELTIFGGITKGPTVWRQANKWTKCGNYYLELSKKTMEIGIKLVLWILKLKFIYLKSQEYCFRRCQEDLVLGDLSPWQLTYQTCLLFPAQSPWLFVDLKKRLSWKGRNWGQRLNDLTLDTRGGLLSWRRSNQHIFCGQSCLGCLQQGCLGRKSNLSNGAESQTKEEFDNKSKALTTAKLQWNEI